MSTVKQVAAYKEIRRLRMEDHQRKVYGMLPILARHPQACGCGRIFNIKDGYGRDGVPCSMRPGDRIVKFEGKWMNTACVDQIQQDRFRATCKYVLEEKTSKGGWWPKAWSNDPKDAQVWRELAAMIQPEDGLPEERITER